MIKLKSGVKIKSGVVLIGGDNWQQVATPTITQKFDGTTFDGIILECTTFGATIYYTYTQVPKPGKPSKPADVTLGSLMYNGQFGDVMYNYFVKAKAWKEGMSPSQQASKTVTSGT